MAGNYNTWGGKNNSWGNRNRKGTGSTRGNRGTGGRGTTHYEPSKAFNVLAGGICLFMLGAFGLNAVTGAISSVKDGIDTVSDIKDSIVQKDTNTNSNRGNTGVVNKLDYELDSQDVSDILDYISDGISDVSIEELQLISYSDTDTLEKYTKNIVNNLDKYSDAVTFGVMCEAANSEAERSIIEDIVSNNTDILPGHGVTQVFTGAISGLSNSGDTVVTITYVK